MIKSASLKKRFLALLIDLLLILLYSALLFAVSSFVYLIILDGFPEFNETEINLISLTLVVPVTIFSVLFELGKKHATPGKRIIGIRVLSADGRLPGLGQIVIRNIVKFLPWQFAHMMIFRGFSFGWVMPDFWMVMLILSDILPLILAAFVLSGKNGRGLQDLAAYTLVAEI